MQNPCLIRPLTGVLFLAAAAPLWAQSFDAKFINGVNLTPFELVAVQHDGRFKTFDTLARSAVRNMSYDDELVREDAKGGQRVKQTAGFTYLDMLFRPEAYREDRMIYVKELGLRQSLTFAARDRIDKKTLHAILKDGRVSVAFLSMPEVRAALDAMSSNVMTTARKVNILENNAAYTNPRLLASFLRIIPPPESKSIEDKWLSIEDLQSAAPSDSVHAGMNMPRRLGAFTPEAQQALSGRWGELRKAWQAQDAPAVNAALAALAGQLRQVNPAVYPSERSLSLEHWYYRYNKMMWSWFIYLIAVVLLLMGVVYRWPRAVTAGACAFGVGFLLHTIATGIRWYLAGHIPNSNMFEAVTAAAWLGGAVAIFLELGPRFHARRLAWRIAGIVTPASFVLWLGTVLWQRIPIDAWQQWHPVAIAALIVFAVGCMALISLTVAERMIPARGLPLLAAASTCMIALMCGQFFKNDLSSDIGRTMPVLNDLWLYIHTNMIIASYALIGMAFVTAAIYLVGRMLTMPFAESTKVWLPLLIFTLVIPMLAVGDVYDRIAGLLRPAGPVANPVIRSVTLSMIMPAWAPFLIVLGMYAVGLVARLVSTGGARRARAAWEGAGMGQLSERGLGAVALAGGVPASVVADAPYTMRAGGGGAVGAIAVGKTRDDGGAIGFAKVLDGATMLLLELSFIMLWTGIIMGAIWADHSWGRPWGWDPKEVFALNTWIIFLILVHVRLKVVDRELWTAFLAVVGTAVMMFNWVVVNFFIVGLHSYA